MKPSMVGVVCLLSCVSLFSQETKPPRVVTLDGWVESPRIKDRHWLWTKIGEDGVLSVVSIKPFEGDAAAARRFMEAAAETYPKMLQDTPEFSGLEVSARQGQIRGGVFSGQYITFQAPTQPVMQALFLISDAAKLYRGDFVGPKADWPEALSIIEKFE